MRVVWKYPLPVEDRFTVEMPKGAEILEVAEGEPAHACIWALVNPHAEREKRRFRVFGTGHPISDHDRLRHVGTARTMAGRLIWHVFEETA